jgi:hypothetical protein
LILGDLYDIVLDRLSYLRFYFLWEAYILLVR